MHEHAEEGLAEVLRARELALRVLEGDLQLGHVEDRRARVLEERRRVAAPVADERPAAVLALVERFDIEPFSDFSAE